MAHSPQRGGARQTQTRLAPGTRTVRSCDPYPDVTKLLDFALARCPSSQVRRPFWFFSPAVCGCNCVLPLTALPAVLRALWAALSASTKILRTGAYHCSLRRCGASPSQMSSKEHVVVTPEPQSTSPPHAEAEEKVEVVVAVFSVVAPADGVHPLDSAGESVLSCVSTDVSTHTGRAARGAEPAGRAPLWGGRRVWPDPGTTSRCHFLPAGTVAAHSPPLTPFMCRVTVEDRRLAEEYSEPWACYPSYPPACPSVPYMPGMGAYSSFPQPYPFSCYPIQYMPPYYGPPRPYYGYRPPDPSLCARAAPFYPTIPGSGAGRWSRPRHCGSGGRKKIGPDVCLGCLQSGHKKVECPNAQQWVCRICDKAGHVKDDCPNRSKAPGGGPPSGSGPASS